MTSLFNSVDFYMFSRSNVAVTRNKKCSTLLVSFQHVIVDWFNVELEGKGHYFVTSNYVPLYIIDLIKNVKTTKFTFTVECAHFV